MLQNAELEKMQHPLMRAHQIQEHIAFLKRELEGAETEYMRIVLFCRDQERLEDGNYRLIVKTRTTHHIVPEKFAELFPDANAILLSLESKYLGSELDKLTTTKILPSIKMEDAKKYVGAVNLLQACIPSTTEKVSITQDPEK